MQVDGFKDEICPDLHGIEPGQEFDLAPRQCRIDAEFAGRRSEVLL
jgi:hypothetical protein